jgi:hypothetical protein
MLSSSTGKAGRLPPIGKGVSAAPAMSNAASSSARRVWLPILLLVALLLCAAAYFNHTYPAGSGGAIATARSFISRDGTGADTVALTQELFEARQEIEALKAAIITPVIVNAPIGGAPPSLPTRAHSTPSLAPLSAPAAAAVVAAAPVVRGEWIGLKHLRAYAAWHREARASNLAGTTKHKYLTWVNRLYFGAGMGNRLLGAVSGLLMAMLTQRIYLMDDPALQIFQPNAIDFTNPSQAGAVGLAHDIGMKSVLRKIVPRSCSQHLSEDSCSSLYCLVYP